MHLITLLMAALPQAWAQLLFSAIVLFLPSAVGWIAGEVALFRQEIQSLGGFWGTVVQSVVSGAVAALGLFLAAHFPGVTIPSDLSGYNADALLGILVAVLKSVLGITSQLRSARMRRGLKL